MFCKFHGIELELSSPYNPESNGLAKLAVKNMNSLVLRCKKQGKNLLHTISVWRNMTCSDGTLPVQVYFGRGQHMTFPVLSEALDQSVINL